MKRIFTTLFILLLFCCNAVFGQAFYFNGKHESCSLGSKIYYYEDQTNLIKSPLELLNKTFIKSEVDVLNFKLSDHNYWVKFKIYVDCSSKSLYLRIANPTLDEVTLFYLDTLTQTKYQKITLGASLTFNNRPINYQDFIFQLPLKSKTTNEYYIKIKTKSQLELPIYIESKETLISQLTAKDTANGIYIGIMLVMAIYNIFIYFTVKDKSYLYYVLYIFSMLLTQTDSEGLTFRYLWPNHPELNTQLRLLFPFLLGISVIAFYRKFLQTKIHLPTCDKIINIVSITYFIVFSASFLGFYKYAYIGLQLLAVIASLFVLISVTRLTFRGMKTAKFFLFAWSVFLISVILFVLRNANIIPYNNFTLHILQIGSALEVTLLSFALADKINTYRNEKDLFQLETIRVTKENAKLIIEQNIELEKRVEVRTVQLNELNLNLNDALDSLKNTQSHLVDSEKMASLGQLTAGIAHEINNPINFVTSNVKPLQMNFDELIVVIKKYEALKLNQEIPPQIQDIENFKKEIDLDYLKEEIKILLSGISEGARRTAEIVRSLKTFSRLEESDMKAVNINEGIESTLILIKNMMPNELTIIKEMGDIPEVECLGGKINQVFMNLITNGIQAIKHKKILNTKEFLTIKTYKLDNYVYISIKDTGIGVPENIKSKIFEPFFSTKEVGEGTGLGLSIVHSIIEAHNGSIELFSEINKGTEFLMKLPIVQK